MVFLKLVVNRVVHEVMATELISKQSTCLLWIHRMSHLLFLEDTTLEEPHPACYELRRVQLHNVCQRCSVGQRGFSGSVKAPPMVGPTWTRVRLTLGLDYLPTLFQGTALPLLLAPCLLHCPLAHVRCQMIQGCTGMSLPFLSIHICGPGGYTS